jgi:hypothetical protein
VAGEKAAGLLVFCWCFAGVLLVFLRVVLGNVVCSGGFFVVSLW